MLLTPIIARELRVGLRKHGLLKSRVRVAAAGVAVSALFLLIGKFGSGRGWASTLNNFLLLGGIYFATIPAAKIGVGLFSEERRTGALDLLQLTGMNWGHLFAGKLLALTIVASSDLLALFPLIALPFVSGGLSLQVFLATVIALPLLFLFFVSMSSLASAICADDGRALVFLFIAIGLVSLSTLLPYQLGMMLTGSPPFSSIWLCLSPAYGLWLIDRGFGPGERVDLYLTMIGTVLWTVLALVAAASIFAKTSRNDPDGFYARWHFNWSRFARRRSELNQRKLEILDKNAFQWLVGNDRRDSILAWGIMFGVALILLAGWLLWPRAWPSTKNFFVTARVLII
jgi:hypothetical protein